MKRFGALMIGFAMSTALLVSTPGAASAVPGTTAQGNAASIDYVIARGLAQRGVPFSYGGGGVSGPSHGVGQYLNVVGFDASGLTQYAFAGVGIKLPRSSATQYQVGRKVLPAQAQRGDLIFYGPQGTQSVALYLGNQQMLEVSSAVNVAPVRAAEMAPYLVRILDA